MHYAISHTTLEQEFLHITPRRKLLKHTLLHVKEGLVLVKLGKQEYAIEPGSSFWLPFNALCSLTYFPNSKVEKVDVSCRVTTQMPVQGGYVQLNELCQAIVTRLGDHTSNEQAKAELLAVLRTEFSSMAPKLHQSKLNALINQWHWDILDSALSREQQLVLKMREASKMMLSGKKRPQVIEQLFDGDEITFTQLEAVLLGK
ncbi:AraC family transcriptional regulator [Vibrio sinaloensis]|uniref:AraC family transcriptional regulator n=1 Tax=Photobacterium sp. (strain ATCC 43367) TaxID=379097 RepID=UPI0035E6AA9F